MRSLLAACLNPDPQRRPTVRDLIAHLEPPALSRPQPQTPRALAQRAVFEEPTRPYASASAPALADHTLMATERRTVLAGDSRGQRPDLKPVARPPGGYSSEELPASAAAATLGKRVRRFTLGLAAAGVCGGLVALNPFWGGFALAAVVWLLRSGSLAASEVSNRRQQRGRRWYDGPLVVLRVPWELLRASIGSVLLAATGLALALAVALLGYAFGAGDAATLFGCGFAFAVAVWTGPGGSGVRAPLARLTAPVAVRWQRWLPVFFVLLVLATGLTGLAQTRGTSWEPVGERPLSGPVFGL